MIITCLIDPEYLQGSRGATHVLNKL